MTLVSSVWREVTQKLGLLKALIGFCTIAGEESKRKAEPRTRSASRLSLAEMKRFELLRRGTPDLPHFECGPFSHLGTSPWCYESADSLFIILPCFSSVNTRFCRFLISRSSLKNPLSIWEHSSCKTPRVTST